MTTACWRDTAFTRMAGVDLPIVQAPMGGTSGPALAAAVSNAGGLGMLGLAAMDGDMAIRTVRETRALTDRPFGVNVVLKWSPDEWFGRLIDEGVKIFSFAWGDCERFVEPVHRAGGIVINSVGSVEEARQAAHMGIDAIVAQGWEAGGHVRGTLSTMAFVPAAVDAVGKLPVLAAGGIADGRGVAAALSLGAAGAWVGTRYLAASEALVHPHYRARLLAATGADTLYSTELFHLGWEDIAHRVLTCRASQRWEAAGRAAPGRRGDDGRIVGRFPGGDIETYACMTASADVEGDVEEMSMWCGQGVGLFDREESAAEITRKLADGADAVLGRLGRM